MTSRRAIVLFSLLAGLAGVMLGIASSLVVERGVFAQSRGTRRVIRPEKGPNTGLQQFSPGVLVGNTLSAYLWSSRPRSVDQRAGPRRDRSGNPAVAREHP